MTSNEMADKLGEIGHKIAPETIRKDWTKGAPRTSPDKYLRWRAKHITQEGHGDPDAKALRATKTQKEIELLDERLIAERRNNEIEAGLLWKKADVIAAQAASAARVYAVLRSKLLVELPAQCAGQPADVIATANEAAIDRACEELSAK